MFIDYCKAQKANLGNTLKYEPFAVLNPLGDQLYQQSIALMSGHSSPVYGRLLLVCHKEFLVAASLVGQGQPDDADPITRRAIEAIRLAAAIKAEPGLREKNGAMGTTAEWRETAVTSHQTRSVTSNH